MGRNMKMVIIVGGYGHVPWFRFMVEFSFGFRKVRNVFWVSLKVLILLFL